MSYNQKNKNAKKQETDRTSTFIGRCTPQDKAKWVKKAKSLELGLTDYIIQTLNKDCENVD